MIFDHEAKNGRERNILAIAQQLLNADIELGEATIDSQFLYRFSPSWYRSMSAVRHMIWSLIGQESDKPLSRENDLHLRWILHIEQNKGVAVRWSSSTGRIIYNTITNRDGYSPFNHDWSEQLWNLLDNTEEFEQIWTKIWWEALQISRIHGEIIRLGHMYSIAPLDSEEDDFSPKQIQKFHQRIFNWIVWGNMTPVFIWPMSQLLESRLEGITRTVRPHKMSLGYWKNLESGGRKWVETKLGNTKRMTNSVRIRTWAIYYLTKRGGGERTEQAAVDLWNHVFPEPEKEPYTVKNFRRERSTLFSRGSKKTASNDSLYMGLSWWGKAC